MARIAESVTVYLLRCPITKQVRYVGRCTTSLKDRLSFHLSTRQKCTREWLRLLRRDGLRPYIEPIETVAYPDGPRTEKRWIAHYFKEGALLNIYLGSSVSTRRVKPRRRYLEYLRRAADAGATPLRIASAC